MMNVMVLLKKKKIICFMKKLKFNNVQNKKKLKVIA